MESVINMKKNEKAIKTKLLPFPLNDNDKISINNLDFWPVVYILLNKEKIYIGQTNDLIRRMESHKKYKVNENFKKVLLISSDLFNQSAIYDIESKLIKYVSADSKKGINVTNQKINQSDFKYFQKNKYNKDIFYEIWQELIENKIVNDNIEVIENKSLFKYSPFTSFSRQQLEIIENIIDTVSIVVENDYSIKSKIIENLEKNNSIYNMEQNYDDILNLLTYQKRILQNQESVSIIEGGPGTGKTLLAVKVIYELKKKYKVNGKIGFCVPQSSNYNQIKKLLKSLKLLETDLNVEAIKPSEIHENKFDVLIIDEAHRLRHRYPKIEYIKHLKENSELYQAVENSKHLILMYDFNQSVRPSDINFKYEIENLKKIFKKKLWKIPMKLNIQFRVQSTTDFTSFIKQLLQIEKTERIVPFNDSKYDIRIFDSIEEMHNEIKKKNEEMGLSRMVSGYYVKWISQTNKEFFDFENEGYKIKWNTKYENWLNSPDAINEIGCIHTIQGHDLNYVGVIIGNDLKYNSYEKKLYVDKKNFYDNNAKPIKGSPNEEEDLLRYIKNSYYVLLTHGIKGLYIYIKDSELKKYFMENLKF